MKKLYTLIIAALLLTTGKSFSQSFTYASLMNSVDSTPGSELIFYSRLINNTTSTIQLDPVRDQDVIPEAPTWESAFCIFACYLPTTDSVREDFFAGDTIEFSYHMYTSSTPDHATGIMRFKNVTNPSNVITQSFFGSTDGTFAGVNDLNVNANVNIYPMPIASGDVFSMNISLLKPVNSMSLVVYNTLGSVVSTTPTMIEGINFMSLDLSAGVYSYSLLSDNTPISSGKIVITR